MNANNSSILILFALVLLLLYLLCRKKNKVTSIKLTKSETAICSLDNFECTTPNNVFYPSTLTELQSTIDNTTGTVSSTGDDIAYNNLFQNNNVVISTERLNKIINLNKDTNELVVEAGCKVRTICKYLNKRGLTLKCIPDLDLSIGNACMTAAHGTNVDTGTIVDQISHIDVVLANGTVLRLGTKDPQFLAFATSIGCLGVIYSITLQCIPIPEIETAEGGGSWEEIKEYVFPIVQEYGMTTFSINPETKMVNINMNRIISDSKKINKRSKGKEYYRYSEIKQNTYSDRITKAVVAIPFENTIEAIDSILELYKKYSQKGWNDNEDIIVRFSSADKTWMSPAYGRVTTWLHVATNLGINDRKKAVQLLKEVELEMIQKYSGRPAWTTMRNKHFYHTLLNHSNSTNFIKLRNLFDPDHRFSNRFVDKVL